tara:strand:- start:1423 stop:1836 length:414 start_codon:yes stop_codon:yes gene_type:complete
MQNCFRKYPEVYGSELEGADDDDEPELSDDAATPALADTNSSQSSQSVETPRTPSSHKTQPQRETGAPDKAKMSSEPSSKPAASEKAETESRSLGLVPDNYKPSATKSEEPVSESKDLVPKAAFDAGDENTKVLERK